MVDLDLKHDASYRSVMVTLFKGTAPVIVTTPRPPEQDELQALIEDARRRARRRRAGYASVAVIVVVLGGCLYAALGRRGHSLPSAGSVTWQSCRSSDWRLVSSGENGATGAIVTGFGIRLLGSRGCLLRTEVTFSVQRRAGTSWMTLPSIRSNPERVRLDAILRPDETVARTWGWRDYCAGPARLRLLITASGHSATTSRVSPPFCNGTLLPRRWPGGALSQFPPVPRRH